MKKLFFSCLILLSCWSCSLEDDDYVNYNFEFIPIQEVDIPSSFIIGETYQIKLHYNRPSSCHVFHDLYYDSDGPERTIAVVNVVYDNSNCEDLENSLIERSFNFSVIYDQVYIFKFWQGEDENGEDIYLIYEVPVVE